MKTGDYVEIKEKRGSNIWIFNGRKGHITEVNSYCLSVRTDDGENIRDVKEHFRVPPVM